MPSGRRPSELEGDDLRGINVTASIGLVKYNPYLGRDLRTYGAEDFERAVQHETAFIAKLNQYRGQFSVCVWLSPKRSRSFPLARVYDLFQYPYKQVAIIPFIKDEGGKGDRDYLQWDTLAMLSLLDTYVIITYYKDAVKHKHLGGKITKQIVDVEQVRRELDQLMSCRSDPLHWNLDQLDRVDRVAQQAVNAYVRMERDLGVRMHSIPAAKRRVRQLMESKDKFMQDSRRRSRRAQQTEAGSRQPGEPARNRKGAITINNFLGGNYFLTCDNTKVDEGQVFLVENKNGSVKFPSSEAVKEGLMKMALFSNLREVKVNGVPCKPVPTLHLAAKQPLTAENRKLVALLRMEEQSNNFQITLNGGIL
jgi:hypothetical protein